MRKFIIVLLLLLLSSPLTSEAKDYTVGEGDVLKITVYGHDDLATIERISGIGMINFPLLGQVKVLDKTISQISRMIEDMLADGFIVSPQVTVFINEFRSQKATIMGEVSKPGLYELKGNTTFLELVSIAGGLTPDAGLTVSIKRSASTKGKKVEVLTINLQQLIEQGDTSLDVPIYDGDSIYITKAGFFYVTGEVRRPAVYKYKDDTTVIKAITMAGGFTDKASVNKVRIIRKIDDDEVIIYNVHMDEAVIAEDVIVIPESFF